MHPMSPTFLHRLALAAIGSLLAPTLLNAATPTQAAADASGYVGPVWINSSILQFPHVLTYQGITDGMAVVQVEANPDGTISDWLVLSSTHDDIVRHINRSAPEWRFQPATQDGKPVYGTVLLEVRFANNDVISLTASEMTAIFLQSMRAVDERLRDRVANMSQLDRLPEPISVVDPTGGASSRDALNGDAVISFYIDEKGNVRLPIVTRLNCDIGLAAGAFEAIRQWKFTPPTVNGRPMVVRAQQRFVFRAK